MIKLTLIQTSQNRRYELERFLFSLEKQKNVQLCELQYIFVDQGNNADLFGNINKEIDFYYIKTNYCSLSHARNIALPHVKGKYVCFPDDDCWYEDNTIYNVLSFLEVHNEYQGVSGIGYNENGVLTHVFPSQSSIITKENRCAAISYTMFFKYESSIKFDEYLGVGSPLKLGAGEETDYMLQLIEKFDYHFYYNIDIIVHHPASSDYEDKNKLLEKRYLYSRGAGYLMRKHKFSIRYYFRSFYRPFGALILYFFSGDKYKSYNYYLVLKGLLEGFFTKIH